jgi:hypothetical protein
LKIILVLQHYFTMPVTTPMFDSEISEFFGDHIKDGRIICSEKEFKTCFRKLKRHLNISNTRTSKSGAERKRSSFMDWKTQNYESIKDEYFNDFETHTDWSENGIRQYYKSKSLPLEKLEALIEKKNRSGKTNMKPRLMALITIKAGLIWSEMSEDEKMKVNNQNNDNDNETPFEKKKKKGRPRGYKPSNFVVDSAVENALNKSGDSHSDHSSDEEVELEEFSFNGNKYLKDDKGRVFNDELIQIGSIDNDGNVGINK